MSIVFLIHILLAASNSLVTNTIVFVFEDYQDPGDKRIIEM
jgi:hypothetical protein